MGEVWFEENIYKVSLEAKINMKQDNSVLVKAITQKMRFADS